MKFTFVRHGQTDYNKKKLLQGQRIDASLNDAGRGQASRLARELVDDFEAICSSPLKRARQTAEIMADALGVPVEVYNELRERDFGDLTGESWEGVVETYGEEMKKNDRDQSYDYSPYGGESADQVKERVQKFLQKAKRQHAGPVLVVSHSGILRMVHFLYSDSEVLELPNASVHEFEIEG